MDIANKVFLDDRELPPGVEQVTYAEHQPQYENLPVVRLPDGAVLSRWVLSEEERQLVAQTGNVFLVVHTYNAALQPLALMADQPDIGEVTEDGPDKGRLFFYSPLWLRQQTERLEGEPAGEQGGA